MPQIRFRFSLLVLGTLTMLFATAAEAQWALVAKRAIGRVEQMSQQSQQAGGPSYDSAAVMLEAPADKVYAAVLSGVRNNIRGLKITREDSTGLVVQFTNGEQIAGIKVSALSDTVSHLLVTSAHAGIAAQRSGTGHGQRAARVQGNERGVRAGEAIVHARLRRNRIQRSDHGRDCAGGRKRRPAGSRRVYARQHMTSRVRATRDGRRDLRAQSRP